MFLTRPIALSIALNNSFSTKAFNWSSISGGLASTKSSICSITVSSNSPFSSSTSKSAKSLGSATGAASISVSSSTVGSFISSISLVNSCGTPKSVANLLALRYNLLLTNLSKVCVLASKFSVLIISEAIPIKAFLYSLLSKPPFSTIGSYNRFVISSTIPPISFPNLDFVKSGSVNLSPCGVTDTASLPIFLTSPSYWLSSIPCKSDLAALSTGLLLPSFNFSLCKPTSSILRPIALPSKPFLFTFWLNVPIKPIRSSAVFSSKLPKPKPAITLLSWFLTPPDCMASISIFSFDIKSENTSIYSSSAPSFISPVSLSV